MEHPEVKNVCFTYYPNSPALSLQQRESPQKHSAFNSKVKQRYHSTLVSFAIIRVSRVIKGAIPTQSMRTDPLNYPSHQTTTRGVHNTRKSGETRGVIAPKDCPNAPSQISCIGSQECEGGHHVPTSQWEGGIMRCRYEVGG
ncbi:hypothetical protein BJ165DRAFT_866580 [Panaeolus papilionaceus]|nr:hypothetical protein BJ165DRAFT_866580 [Panaeolus papilionaceus]